MVRVQVPNTQRTSTVDRDGSARLGDALHRGRAARGLGDHQWRSRGAARQRPRSSRTAAAPNGGRKDGDRMNTRLVDLAPGLLGRPAHAPHRTRPHGRRRCRACHTGLISRPFSRARKNKERHEPVSADSGPRPSSWCTAGSPMTSSWNGVIDRLQGAGLTTIAPANPLRGVGDTTAPTSATW